jgi:hydrogenase maturation protein HypF
VELEQAMDRSETVGYGFDLLDGEPLVIDSRPMWEELLRDCERAVSPAVISARFHQGLVAALARAALSLSERTGVKSIALSGGCFMNIFLLTALEDRLTAAGLSVHSHGSVPCNDGGLSLGQAVIADFVAMEE